VHIPIRDNDLVSDIAEALTQGKGALRRKRVSPGRKTTTTTTTPPGSHVGQCAKLKHGRNPVAAALARHLVKTDPAEMGLPLCPPPAKDLYLSISSVDKAWVVGTCFTLREKRMVIKLNDMIYFPWKVLFFFFSFFLFIFHFSFFLLFLFFVFLSFLSLFLFIYSLSLHHSLLCLMSQLPTAQFFS